MKINVIGGGPSGLYFALLAKQHFPQAAINVYEQNQRGATYGFGIVLADRGLDRLQKADPESFKAIMGACFVTRHRYMTHPDATLFVEGGGYGGSIARLRLLQILESRCEKTGVRIHYGARLEDTIPYEDADLVVGADGVNSSLRKCHEQAFGTTRWSLTNRLAWYGTDKHFAYAVMAFRRHKVAGELGHFVAVAYPYTERMSTFVAECDGDTWTRLGMEQMGEDQRHALVREVFAEELGGGRLISNKSVWHSLPVVRNQQWSVGHRVLIGDALHSAHPSIGSGTRIAMEDAIALADALAVSAGDVPAALVGFRHAREPGKAKLVAAAEKSFTWFETFPRTLEALAPVPFIFNYLMRTGRVDDARLQAEYPEFMARHGHLRDQASEGLILQATAAPQPVPAP